MKVVHICTMDSGGAGIAAYRLHSGLRKIGVDSKMLVAVKSTNDPSVIEISPENYFGDDKNVKWKYVSEGWNKILAGYKEYNKGMELFTDTGAKFSFDNVKEIKEANIINLHWIAGFFDLNKNYEIIKEKRIVWTLHDMNPFTGGCHYSCGCKKYTGACGACPNLGSDSEADISRQIFQNKKLVYEKLNIEVVTPSRWLAKEASSSSLFKSYNINVIPYGFPLDDFKPYDKNELRKALGLETNKKYVLFGAQSIDNKRKGIEYFLDAVKHLEISGYNDIVILFFGKPSAELKFQSKFEIKGLGFINDKDILAKAYSIADVFVIPSLEDNLPNTVVESFACGTPVVGFNIGGISDMIEHKLNGYIAKEKDHIDLANGIRWVIENNKDNTLTINALKKTHGEYNLEKQARTYIQLYGKLSSEKFSESDRIASGSDNNLIKEVERESTPAKSFLSDKDFLSIKSYLVNKFKIEKVPDDPNGMISINGIHGYLTINDITTLYGYAFKIPKGGTIVEVGSFMGLSAFIMANALIDSNNLSAKIYCIDLWNPWLSYNFDVYKSNIKNSGIDNFITALRGDSLSRSLEISQKSADLVFIDADHSYDGCYNDLLAYFPKLKSNSVLLGHDYGSKIFKVTEAVTDFLNKYNLEQNFELPFQGSSICKIANRSNLSFSIITPSFNQAKYIQRTIESVKVQNYLSLEHIVIDGASNDGTTDILKNTKHVNWLSEPDSGQSDALNKGLKLATGEIIGWLNSDDWYEPGVIEKVNQFFIDNPHKNIVMGDCNLVNEEGEIFLRIINNERGFSELSKYWVARSIPTQPAIFFRKSLIDEYGLLDTNLHLGMDYDLWMRFAQRNRFYHINEVFANYRFHSEAKGGDQDWKKFIPEWESVYKKYIEKYNPLISIVIPCYNYGRYLNDAVQSIVEQDEKNFEIIIVNDGSTDNTEQIANEIIKKYPDYRIILINQKNSGQPAISRNTGIANANGEYILPLDADDKLSPNSLKLYNEAIKSNPDEPVVIYGWMKRFDKNNDTWKTPSFNPNHLLRRTSVPSSSLFHRKVWELNEGYSLNVKGYEDWDFWIGAAENKIKFVHIENVTILYREAESTSLQDFGRKNHEWNCANIILNHRAVYEPEEVQWAKHYLTEYSVPPVERKLHGMNEQFPFSVSLMIANYPELYTKGEIDWAASVLKSSSYRFLKGIRPDKLPLLTIISVNFNTKEWIKLLIEKVKEYTRIPYELIVVDNGSSDGSVEYLQSQKDVSLIQTGKNLGHGPALDYGFSFIRTKYAIVLDSDAHPIHADWINKLVTPLNNECLLSGIHHHRNYAHPACLALELKTFYKYKLTFIPNWPKDNDINKLGKINWDAGEYLSIKILESGKKINLIPVSKRNSGTIVGTEYGDIVYHNFYATRLKTNSQKEFDGVKRENIVLYSEDHFDNQSRPRLAETRVEKANNKFRLSVIITTYNRINLLERVLEAFVHQTVPKEKFEVIIVDDGSNPKAESCAHQFKDKINIKYFYHENSGLAFSRNIGIEYASYEIVAFADDDDIPSPHYVSEHLKSHAGHPETNIAVLGKLEWNDSVQVTPFMDYITKVSGEYFSFENLKDNNFYDVWKWWGGLISCKKELLLKYKPVFDERFTFGYEDTDLAIRMMNDDIKILYNANAKSFIIKKVEFEEFLNRRIKQGRSLFQLELKHGNVVTDRYALSNAYNEYEELAINLEIYKSKINELENALSKFSHDEQISYLNNNPEIKGLLNKLYSLCTRGYLLKGYNESYRKNRIQFKTGGSLNKKLIIGLHAQTLHRKDGVVGGSEITTKGLKKAFEKYENVEKVVRYGTGSYTEINEKLDLVIIEGWEADVPFFIEAVRKKNSQAVIFFWNLSFLGLENIVHLPVNGYLTNSDKMLDVLQKYAPVRKVLLAADPEEIYPTDKVPDYSYDVVYLGMYHPHKSEDIISRMLVEASDFNFAIYGKGWDLHPQLKNYWKGKLPLGKISNLYSSAGIVIGTTEDRQREAGQINNRVFEALACGATFISEYFPELESVFGDHIFYSKQKGDTRKIISDILSNKIERKNPSALRDFIIKNHTYDQRVKQIFDFYSEIVDKKDSRNVIKTAKPQNTLKPFISVCIPTYNRADYLKEAIKSALNQNYDNFEIVIVDDGSTDKTEEVVKEFASPRIRYIKKKNEGRPKTRNRLISEAKGDYILWLDDDDLLAEGMIEAYSSVLKNDPSIDVIYGNLQVFDSESGNRLQLFDPEDYTNDSSQILANLISGKGITFPGSLIRKKLIEEAGGFDEEFPRAQDNELWTRLALKAKFYKLNKEIYLYRKHDANVSMNDFVDRSYESKVIRKIISAYSLQEIYPSLNWKNYNDAESKAVTGIVNGLAGFGDFYNSAKILNEKKSKISGEDLMLLFTLYLKSGNTLRAGELLNSHSEKLTDEQKNQVTQLLTEYAKLSSLLNENNPELIKNELERFVNAQGYSFIPAFLVGTILQQAGDYKSAYRHLKNAVYFNPVSEDCYQKANKIAVELGKEKELNDMRNRVLGEIPLFNGKKTEENSLISVIIPTYNRPDKLASAIESVLTQTYKNFEIIVVKDGGKNIGKIIKKYSDNRIRFINHNKNKGPSSARNAGIKAAKGKYIALLDDDDIYYPNHLETALNNLNEKNKVIYTDAVRCSYIKEGNLPKADYKLQSKSVPYSIDYNRNKLFIGNISPVNCFVFEKSLTDKVGLFDESLQVLEDWEFWLRLSSVTDFKHVKENTVQVNWYNDGSTLTSSKQEAFGKVRTALYKKYENEINAIPNMNEIVAEFNAIWQKDNAQPDPSVSIITLTYNQVEYTKAFVESVFKHTKIPYELIIVDNNSNDETVKYLIELAKYKGNVKVIFNKENLGFPKGVNQSLTQIPSDRDLGKPKYILIANNDIVVTDGWLDRMIEIAESDPSIGIVGPISNSVSGVQLDKEAAYSSIEEMHAYARKIKDKNAGKSFVFPRVAFLCTLIKREVINKIGGLDERFTPGNFEDDDFCLRAQIAGYKTIIAQDVFIHHFGSKSFTAEGLEKYKERLETNKNIFINKWNADPEEIWLKGKSIRERNIMYPINTNKFIENFERARILIEDKEYGIALDSLKAAVDNFDDQSASQLNIDEADLFNLAGNVALMNNEISTAKEYFEYALNKNPQSSKACAGLAEILFIEKNYEAAKTMFEYAIDYDKDNAGAQEGLRRVNSVLESTSGYGVLSNKETNSPQIHKRDDFGHLFNTLNLLGHGVEIGVQAGEFSSIVRSTWKGKYLHLIDRWQNVPGYKDMCNVSDEEQIKLYNKVVNTFINDPDVFIYKMDSAFAAGQFPDEYFDWIYIDADHSYEGCKRDLELWYPKLKPGGIFAGHDFVNGNFAAGEYGVKSAVEEFILNKNVELCLTMDDYLKSWYFIKPGGVQMKQDNEYQTSLSTPNKGNESNSGNLVNEAYDLFKSGEYSESLQKLLTAEKLFNGHLSEPAYSNMAAAFFSLKGYNYLGLNRIEEARENFERALNLDPNSSEACAGLGEYFYINGNNENARIMFEFAVKNNPENSFAQEGLLKVSPSNGDDSQKLVMKFDEILSSIFQLFELKRYNEALEALQSTEELFYSQVENEEKNHLISSYENMKGMVFLALKRNEDAKKSFELALNINPGSSQACAGLGEVFFLSGNDKEAKAMYEWAVKNNPENKFATVGLAKINSILGFEKNHNSLEN
jgi:glycosyltransferase involved in cell wall biosynthesis/predicted O-methyltransferase YrrM